MRVVQTRKLVGPVRLNRTNPLTVGLIDVFVPGHRVNLVSGLSLAATGTASFVGVSQIGISLISSSVSNHFHAVSTAPANVRVDEATLLVVTVPSSTYETTRSMYGFGSTGGYNPLLFIGQSDTNGKLYFFARSDAGTAQNPTVTPPSGTWVDEQKAVLVGARSQSKNVHELYVNGIQAATTTATTIGATTLNATSVGGLRRSTDGIVYNGKTSLCLAWNRCLSAAEIKSISDNPWQIFEPVRVPVKAPASGAYTLTADSAAWQFAAQNATLRVARKLAAANAPWEFAAQNAGLTVARKITAENAPWEFAVQDATLTYAPHTGAYTLTAESAEWQFAVPDATLTYRPIGGSSGGWLPSLPTREERDEYIRRQREALGIIPKRIQPVAKVIKRIAKQAAKRGIEPTVEQVQEVAPFRPFDTQPIADALAINFRIYLALLERDRQEREKTRHFIAEQIEQAKANAIVLETSLRLQEEEEVFVVMSILLAD